MRILDLACGGGHSSRLLANGGAYVVGVDISAEQITIARKHEGLRSLNAPPIQYYVCDAAKFDYGGRFDIVTPTFLFHYASTIEEMHRYATTAFQHLRPGGRLVALNAWRSHVPRMVHASNWSEWLEPHRMGAEGSRVRLHLLDVEGNEVQPIDYYHWEPTTYESVLRHCGFTRVCWVNHRIPDELRVHYENWRELEEHNSSCVLTAWRP